MVESSVNVHVREKTKSGSRVGVCQARKAKKRVFNAIMSPIMGKKITLRKSFTFTDKSEHQPKKGLKEQEGANRAWFFNR